MPSYQQWHKGLLSRWKPETGEASQREPDTAEPNDWFEAWSSQVAITCQHLESEWGQVKTDDVWVPYLELSFRKEPEQGKTFQLPFWAKFTVEVKPVPAATTPPTNNGTVTVPAVEAAAELKRLRPCLDPSHICPPNMYCGIPLEDTKTRGGTLAPTGGAAGAIASLGSLTLTLTETYKDVVVMKWTIVSDTTKVNNSDRRRRAYWVLEGSKGSPIIPEKLRVGFIVKHEKIAFQFCMKIEGNIRERWFGELKFVATTDVYTVEAKEGTNNFTDWATASKMYEHMKERDHEPIELAKFIKIAKQVG
ncbi:hypothetical protein DL98DRAFT_521659 [Cadophora sp. DSE1049]|nr:hypothetical protein DL98DRAFT_521659 [Cadophora sp. DSE1049]